jgi:hypothetical protein
VITDEQIERWYKRTCSRCGRHGYVAGHWPDGHVCRTCRDRALRNRGQCPACGRERPLPGLVDGRAVCRDCAGIRESFACSRCGQESKLHRGRLCTRCTLADRLAELLGDETGCIRPELVPLARALTAMDNPLSGLTWLYTRGKNGSAAELLRSLGRGEVELTHEAFHVLEPRLAAEHLRDLLISCGVLPAVDKQLCSFERWLVGYLPSISDPERQRLIRRFATWDVLPRIRLNAENGPLTPGSRKYASDQVTHAVGFLTWLDERQQTLRQTSQGDIDAWFAEHKEHDRNCLRSFLRWAAANRLIGRHELPKMRITAKAPLTEPQRLALLRKVLTDETGPLRSRVAAAIVLLYAQPLTRIARLTLDDVIRADGEMFLRLGEPATPVPAPVADLIESHIAARTNMRTATNPGSRWLLPGRRADQPLQPGYLSELLQKLGVPTSAGRGAALRQHLLEVPAPVIADALGYHYKTTARLSSEAGAGWSRYASGDHTKSPPTPHN